MSTLDKSLRNLDKSVFEWFNMINEKDNGVLAVSIMLIIYAAVVVQFLPNGFLSLFEYGFVKLIMLLLIAYTARTNEIVGILMAVAFLVTLITLNKNKLDARMKENMEGLENMDVTVQEKSLSTTTHPDMAHNKITQNEIEINPESVVGIEKEMKEQPATLEECEKHENYHNSFYPQYVNMTQETYDAKYTGNEVGGFDNDDNYASI